MKTEKTFAVIFIIGLCTYFFNVPGSDLILIFSLFLLALFYFPMGFYFFSDKTLKQQNITLSILGGIVLFLGPVSVLFKLMHWPGQVVSLMIAPALITILLAITFILNGKRPPELERYYKNYLARIIFWLSLSYIFYLIPGAALVKLRYHSDPERTKLELNVLQDPDNAAYEYALEKYCRQTDSIYMAKERQN